MGMDNLTMQDLFDGLMAAAKAEKLEGKGVLTIEELITALKEIGAPKDMVVLEYDGRFTRFGELDSYRGYYSDLAINPYSNWSDGFVSVEAAIDDLTSVIGDELEGYKGGMFRMEADTLVWASPYGDASGVAVTGVRLTTEEERVGLYPPMVVVMTKEIN